MSILKTKVKRLLNCVSAINIEVDEQSVRVEFNYDSALRRDLNIDEYKRIQNAIEKLVSEKMKYNTYKNAYNELCNFVLSNIALLEVK